MKRKKTKKILSYKQKMNEINKILDDIQRNKHHNYNSNNKNEENENNDILLALTTLFEIDDEQKKKNIHYIASKIKSNTYISNDSTIDLDETASAHEQTNDFYNTNESINLNRIEKSNYNSNFIGNNINNINNNNFSYVSSPSVQYLNLNKQDNIGFSPSRNHTPQEQQQQQQNNQLQKQSKNSFYSSAELINNNATTSATFDNNLTNSNLNISTILAEDDEDPMIQYSAASAQIINEIATYYDKNNKNNRNFNSFGTSTSEQTTTLPLTPSTLALFSHLTIPDAKVPVLKARSPSSLFKLKLHSNDEFDDSVNNENRSSTSVLASEKNSYNHTSSVFTNLSSFNSHNDNVNNNESNNINAIKNNSSNNNDYYIENNATKNGLRYGVVEDDAFLKELIEVKKKPLNTHKKHQQKQKQQSIQQENVQNSNEEESDDEKMIQNLENEFNNLIEKNLMDDIDDDFDVEKKNVEDSKNFAVISLEEYFSNKKSTPNNNNNYNNNVQNETHNSSNFANSLSTNNSFPLNNNNTINNNNINVNNNNNNNSNSNFNNSNSNTYLNSESNSRLLYSNGGAALHSILENDFEKNSDTNSVNSKNNFENENLYTKKTKKDLNFENKIKTNSIIEKIDDELKSSEINLYSSENNIVNKTENNSGIVVVGKKNVINTKNIHTAEDEKKKFEHELNSLFSNSNNEKIENRSIDSNNNTLPSINNLAIMKNKNFQNKIKNKNLTLSESLPILTKNNNVVSKSLNLKNSISTLQMIKLDVDFDEKINLKNDKHEAMHGKKLSAKNPSQKRKKNESGLLNYSLNLKNNLDLVIDMKTRKQ
jgi:hypothetical protein